ncbi:PST family polysaccharide transporter [Bacillus fengqiuensis]|nr:PST family polysaccharide transporter [Bacillus fengqiuensis]
MKKKILENLSALAIMQAMNYLLPFITLPYLVHVLGMEYYGTYVFSQSLISYFLIFVDFGFDLYATRQVSIYREDKGKLEMIINAVLTWKFIFIILSVLILLILTSFVPMFKEYQTVHLLNFGVVIGTMLFANFYYSGIEEMKFITILNASAKILFTIFIFIFIDNPNDLELTALINSGGYIVVGLFSIWLIHKKYNIHFVRIPKKFMWDMLTSSAPFFWSRLAVSIYTVSNTFIIGVVLGNTAAGIFSAADKVFRGIVSIYSPLNGVFYPFIAHRKDVTLYKKVIKYAISVNLFLSLLLFISSEWIIGIIFGAGFEESSTVLRIFSIVLVYIMPSILFGYPLLGGMGYTNEVNKSVIYSSIVHLILLLVCIPILDLKLVAFLVLITELNVFLYRTYYVKHYELLK